MSNKVYRFFFLLLFGIISCVGSQKTNENPTPIPPDEVSILIDPNVPEEIRRLLEELGEEGFEEWQREEARRLKEAFQKQQEELRRQQEQGQR